MNSPCLDCNGARVFHWHRGDFNYATHCPTCGGTGFTRPMVGRLMMRAGVTAPLYFHLLTELGNAALWSRHEQWHELAGEVGALGLLLQKAGFEGVVDPC